MDPREIVTLEADLSSQMQSRLGIKGSSLDVQAAKAGRKLPRKAKRAATELAEASRLAGHPKLALQVDTENAAQNVALLKKYIGRGTAPDRRNKRIQILRGIAMNLIVIFAIYLLVVLSRGLI